MENLKKEYENFGFFKLENVFDKIFIKKIIDEINSCKELACVKIFNKENKRIIHNNVDVYYDKKGSLRRIERLYDKGEALKTINKKISFQCAKYCLLQWQESSVFNGMIR